MLTIQEGHFWFNGGSLHKGAHHNRQVLLELLPQDLTHASPSGDHVGDLHTHTKKKKQVSMFIH